MDLKFATVKLRKVAMVGTENLDELFKTGGGFTIVCLWYQGPDWKSAETPLLVIPSQATDQKQIDLKACLDANFQEDVEKQARVCSDCKKSSFFRNQTFLWQVGVFSLVPSSSSLD
jgi:hypothetical protein